MVSFPSTVPMPRKFRLSACALLCLAASACTTTSYEDAQVKFKRTSFLNQAKISKLEKTQHGVLMEGYVNDQVAGAAAITKAAVEGALQGAK